MYLIENVLNFLSAYFSGDTVVFGLSVINCGRADKKFLNTIVRLYRRDIALDSFRFIAVLRLKSKLFVFMLVEKQ